MTRTLRAERASLGRRVVDFSLVVEPGTCLVLVGPNGAGKSSLLRLLAGLEAPSSGRVLLGDRDAHRESPRARAQHIAWLPQRPEISAGMVTEEVVAAARFRFGESLGTLDQKAREVLVRVGEAALIGKRVDRISGGELQRVLLAALVAQEAPILLVDEPANHLDPAHQVDTYRRLGREFAAGKTVVVVTHDVRLARLLGPSERVEVLGMAGGRRSFQLPLGDPGFPGALSNLYGVPFVEEGPGALALDLRAERTVDAEADR